jgi:hypothetical protein
MLEMWKRQLGRGDYFGIVVKDGLVIYGYTMEACDGDVIRARTFSNAFPYGEEDLIDTRHIDTPLAQWQFVAAKRMGFPGDARAFRTVAMIGAVGKA